MRYLLTFILSTVALLAEDLKEPTETYVSKEQTTEISEPKETESKVKSLEIPSIKKLQGNVNSGRLNVRARPSTRFEIIDVIKRNALVEIIEVNDDWLKIIAPENSTAWIPARSANEEGIIINNGTKAYAGPGVEYSSLGSAPINSKVKILYRRDNSWLKVKAEPWMNAWVSSKYVKIENIETKEVPVEKTDIEPIPVAQKIDTADNEVTREVDEAVQKSYDFEERRKELDEIKNKLKNEITKAEEEKAELEKKLEELKGSNENKVQEINQAEKELYDKNEEILRGQEKVEVVNNADNDIAREEFELNVKDTVVAKLGSLDEEELIVKQGQSAVKGIIMPVRDEDRQIVDFALAVKIDKEYYPLCYVIGKIDNLHTLYEKEIALTGVKKRKEGWSRPVLHMDQYKIIRKK